MITEEDDMGMAVQILPSYLPCLYKRIIIEEYKTILLADEK